MAGYSFLCTSCYPQHAPSVAPAGNKPVMAAAATLILFQELIPNDCSENMPKYSEG